MNKANKQRLIELKYKYDRERYPNFPYPVPYKKNDNSTNGLTNCIIDFLNYTGHQAERISSMGRVIKGKDRFGLHGEVYKGESIYIPGTSTKGTADISATINGKSVKIEVKFGKDRQSEVQKDYQNSVERAGGVYFIARTFDDFIEFYDNYQF